MSAQMDAPTPRKPLRVWPGVVLVVVQWIAWLVVPAFLPDFLLPALMVTAVCALGVILWWLIFSRAPWYDRIAALILVVLGVIVAKQLAHVSIATGSFGFLIIVMAIPVMSLALVAAAVISRRLSAGTRRAVIAAAIVVGCGVFTLMRTAGATGDFKNEFHWRWSKTPEERLLAQGDEIPASPAAPAAPVTFKGEAEWSGFRGPQRDSTVRGVQLKTDWSSSRPVELWRRPIGPGWSSFAVRAGRLYTQEQRGKDEIVACYDVSTGKPVWRHGDPVRFYESVGGPGPRGTPTLSNGRVYSLGATGIMNALDEVTGAVVWSRNAVNDTGAKIPGWGISGSPLVVGDLVIVAASGNLVAYEVATGKPRWFGPKGEDNSYSSPHLLTIHGVQQIVLMTSTGATSVALADGKLLWNHSWPSDTRIMQPAMAADGELVITVGDGMGGAGTRRIGVKQGQAGQNGSGGWTTEERWTSEELNANFTDFVIHKGHIYGFDYGTLVCVDLNDGKQKWKSSTRGYGQLVLLPDQDLLLMLSEKGELVLAKASPDQFTEFARLPVLEGKTWNHPVLVGDVVLVRNDHEMAAFRLPLAQ